MDRDGLISGEGSPLWVALERLNKQVELIDSYRMEWHCYPLGGPFMATQTDRYLDIGGGGPVMPIEFEVEVEEDAKAS